MAQVLGDTHDYVPLNYNAKQVRPSIRERFSDEDTGTTVKVYDGQIEGGPINSLLGGDKVFYPDQEDLLQAQEDEVQWRADAEEYDFEEFLDEYGLHGEATLQGRHGREETLVDTEDGVIDTNFEEWWDRADALLDEQGLSDGEYALTGDNAELLTPVMLAAGVQDHESYDDLVHDLSIVVNEVERRDEAPFRSTAKER